MTVLVTGGTGFIGSRLAADLVRRGERVRVLAQTNTPAEESNAAELERAGVEVVLGSVCDPSRVATALRDVERVIHLAAAQHETNVPESYFWNVNVGGTANLVEASRAERVARFVHGGTIGVLEARPGEVAGEHSPTRPSNAYGRTKLEAERLLARAGDSFPAVVVRISETYGPGDRRLLKMFRGIARGRFPRIGAGSNLHHPIYVDDLVEALRRAAWSDPRLRGPWVLAGPRALTTAEMIAIVARHLDRPPPRLRLPLRPLWVIGGLLERALPPLGLSPPLHRRRLAFFTLSYRFGANGAASALGFVPSVDFDEGARRTLAWYRQQNWM